MNGWGFSRETQLSKWHMLPILHKGFNDPAYTFMRHLGLFNS